MRWRIAVAVFAALAGVVGCSGEPAARTAADVPERWYTTVDDALAEQPEVTSTAQLQNGGRCPLRDEVVLDGEKVSDVADHGVVRLGGDIPAVLCSWYEETVVDVEVAHAPTPRATPSSSPAPTRPTSRATSRPSGTSWSAGGPSGSCGSCTRRTRRPGSA